jgi:hypothetical protein
MYRTIAILGALFLEWLLIIVAIVFLINRARHGQTQEFPAKPVRPAPPAQAPAPAQKPIDGAIFRRHEYIRNGKKIDCWLNEHGQPKQIIGIAPTSFKHPFTHEPCLAMVGFVIDAWNLADAWAVFDRLAAQAQRDFHCGRRKLELQMMRGESI